MNKKIGYGIINGPISKKHFLNKKYSGITEYISKKTGINPLMGWESSTDTYSEIKLQINSKKLAIEYAKKK